MRSDSEAGIASDALGTDIASDGNARETEEFSGGEVKCFHPVALENDAPVLRIAVLLTFLSISFSLSSGPFKKLVPIT